LQLQAMTQLPEFDHTLNLSLTCNDAPDNSAQALAWWIPAARTTELFDAFSAQSLFLAAVMPRPAWLIAGLGRTLSAQGIVIQDSDRGMLTVVASSRRTTDEDKRLNLSCLQTVKEDLLNPALEDHWQKELARAGIEKIDYIVASADDFMQLLRQHNLQETDYKTAATAAFPAPALAARHQLDRGRRRTLLLKGVAAAVALVILPFVYQSWQLNRLDNRLAEIRELSAAARQHQATVREFETQWGVMTEFPDQDVSAAMLALQQVINPGV